MKKFLSLHTHSTYSPQDGLGHIREMLEECRAKGLTSLAITDHGNANHFADLYLQSKEFGIKGIYGNEFYFIPSIEEMNILRNKADTDENLTKEQIKEIRKQARKYYHLTLIAKNNIGLKNLFTLTYLSFKDGFYYKPRIDRKLLHKYREGIICASGCLAGEIQRNIIGNDWDVSVEATKFYKNLFKDNFYLEMQINEMEEQKISNEGVIKLSQMFNVPLIITNDNHYIKEEHALSQQTLLLLQSKTTYADVDAGKDFWEFGCKSLYMKSYDEMEESWNKWAKEYISKKVFVQAMENTLKVDYKIDDIKVDESIKLPQISENPDEELEKLCKEGLKEKGLSKRKEYIDRLNFELDIIKKKGFSNYFLVSREIISNVKKEMLVGPGRGSSSGSLVAYCIDITNVDPIRFDLLFDRFINISRDDYPDIDTDFENVDKAKQWIIDRFGSENVALISTFGTFKMKGLIRDLGRVYGISLNEINELTKTIDSAIRDLYPEENKSTLILEFDKFYENVPEFKQFMDKYPKLTRDFKVLHNQIRHIGKHAGGVIICDNLYEQMPTMVINGVLQTGITEGLSSKNLGKLGFIKFDILGLSTLGIIHDTAKLIGKCTKKSKEEILKEIHPDYINLEVDDVYKNVFMKGILAGVFQFGGEGITELIKKSNTDCFEDLVAITSLYRPGPLKSGVAESYGYRKKNPNKVEYIHPILKEILNKTYGLIIFQEQMMQIGNKLGGLSLVETNTLRKVIIKQSNKKDEKKNKIREELHQKFLSGSKEKGLTDKQASEIWQLMENFAEYGFCRAHAVAYSIISYQTAYLKYFYPQYFYTALLNSAISDSDRLKIYLNEIIKFGIKVLPIDINKSDKYFSIENDSIRMGFLCAKGVGLKACDAIMEERDKINGFKKLNSFFDSKIKWRTVNKKVIEALIKSGAFDSFEKNRKRILEAYKFMKEKKVIKKDDSKFIYSFDHNDDVIPYAEQDLVDNEYELLGFNFYFDPFQINKRDKKLYMLKRIKKVENIEKVNSNRRLACIIISKKEIVDKNGNLMAFLKIRDVDGKEADITVFASAYEFLRKDLKSGNVHLLKIKRNNYNGKEGFILNTGFDEDQEYVKECALNIDDPKIKKWLVGGNYDKF